jgi:hypothetical protein
MESMPCDAGLADLARPCGVSGAELLEPVIARIAVANPRLSNVVLILALPCLAGLSSGCTSGEKSAFHDDTSVEDATAEDARPDVQNTEPPQEGGIFAFDGSAVESDCLPGHYLGTLEGTYASSLTVVGLPIPFAANIDLLLERSASGGEIPVYTVANGTLTGLSTLPNGLFSGLSSQLRCRISGSLDCAQKKLIDGALRDCAYCFLGADFDGGAFYDGGACSGIEGHFQGPLYADYDSTTHAFVHGTWNAQDLSPLDDGGVPLPDGGAIDDAGLPIGPGNYGGSGTWEAGYAGEQ